MKVAFTPEGWDDYLFWQKQNKKILSRINTLIKETIRSPFSGMAKPEPLRHELKGLWSRRIDEEHRFVYDVKDSTITVISLRFHYRKT